MVPDDRASVPWRRAGRGGLEDVDGMGAVEASTMRSPAGFADGRAKRHAPLCSHPTTAQSRRWLFLTPCQPWGARAEFWHHRLRTA